MSFKIGNYFEYEYNGGLYRYSRRIVGDTLVQSNGNRYFKIEYISPIPSPPSYQFERIDSSGDWYTFYTGTQQQCLAFRLNVPLGTSFLDGCGGVNYRVLQDTFSISTILGSNGPYYVRKYHLEGLAQLDNYIARKFQLYYWYSYEVGNYAHLVGAIVDSVVYGSVSAIKLANIEIPSQYKLYQNYPNPFNPNTEIRFSLPKEEYVTIEVYNLLGEKVVTLINRVHKDAGSYSVTFNGSNLASGVYFYRIDAGTYNATKKMVLIK